MKLITKSLKVSLMVLFFILGGNVSASSLGEYKINDIGGKEISLNDYKGKVILVVNIATKCGYTPQLKGLEALYQKYSSKGFVVLGIPSNDFGGQTPEKEGDVKKFCMLNYGITFPLTSKVVVKGSQKHPLITGLISLSKEKKEIGWNFEKFLIDKKGQVVDRFESSVKPDDDGLNKKINSIL